jgi:hypothetical protein
MKRARAFAIAVLVTGTAQTTAAQIRQLSTPQDSRVFSNNESSKTARSVSNLFSKQNAVKGAIRTRPSVRFGSGLEDDAPTWKPNVFLQSGLETQRVVKASLHAAPFDRFGSGLEDDASTHSDSIIRQSGIDNLKITNAKASTLLNVRFGSGLEKNAPPVRRKMIHMPGF